jgi:hypothetical protein
LQRGLLKLTDMQQGEIFVDETLLHKDGQS